MANSRRFKLKKEVLASSEDILKFLITYHYQLDFHHNDKKIRATIKEVEFLPADTHFF